MISGMYADKAVEKAFKSNKQLGARDRAFVAESVYGIIRFKRFYTFLLGQDTDIDLLVRCYFYLKNKSVPDWLTLDPKYLESIDKNLEEGGSVRKIKESIPDWMDDLGIQELEKHWDSLLHSLNQPAAFVIRSNSLKTEKDRLAKLLENQGILSQDPGPNYPSALVLSRQNIFQNDLFKAGLFEVQDANSQLIAPFLDVQSGMRVIDACAGAGGKSLHLAALMKNKGTLLCLDKEAYKLNELRNRSSRAGVSIIETRPIESTKTIKRLHRSCDRLLLDVPCSGLGVLRRNPDAKWKLSPSFISEIHTIQAQILSQYSEMLKPGGKLVYATCSILPSENQKQVSSFLEASKNFELEEESTIWPDQKGFDGFYMARLTRKNN